MPLSKDDPALDYGGSWADASEGWPQLQFETEEAARQAFGIAWRVCNIPYGSYVLVDKVLRLETREYVARVFGELEQLSNNKQAEKMTFDGYQKLALRTEATPDFATGAKEGAPNNHEMARLIHGLMGLNTESGELTDMIKKHLMYGRKFDSVNVIEECGDALWYISLALDAVGCSMSDCADRNIRKLQTRFPEKFTSEKALVRDLDAERAELEDPRGDR